MKTKLCLKREKLKTKPQKLCENAEIVVSK